VETEDVNFNALYRVYCDNGFEVFNALTPKLMTLMMESNLLRQVPTLLVFHEDRLHILIWTRKSLFSWFGFQDLDVSLDDVRKSMEITRSRKISLDTLKTEVLLVKQVIDLH